MLFKSILSLALAFAPVAFAANIDVQVGPANAFAFAPTTITPDVGDTITFTFLSRNHSATTTTFDSPCDVPAGGVGPGAFDTGFFDATTEVQTAVVTIADTDPHFVTCRQAAGAHCRLGMVMAINPPPDMTEAQLLANALAS
ncbi:hypothetical protein BDZ89DRAFT_1202446 [Hymenopellis radicata]|nr:hypothetical protein BDZ89DRAFT_1202446 [Hymenopellis radicata]